MPEVIHQEQLMCGYKRCCPSVKVLEDGSMELTDEDPANGSVGTIKLRPEVLDRLVELRALHKK